MSDLQGKGEITMFFAMLMDTDNYKTQFEYIGPFESVKDCEKVCKEQNEKRQYRGSVRFVVQEFRKA